MNAVREKNMTFFCDDSVVAVAVRLCLAACTYFYDP